MNEQLKPTNEEISAYIFNWIDSLDGNGLMIVDDDLILEDLAKASLLGWKVLRDMFAPVLYDSIQDYVDDTKREKDE